MNNISSSSGVVINTASINKNYDLNEFVDLCLKYNFKGASLSDNDIKLFGSSKINDIFNKNGLIISTFSKIGPLDFFSNQSMNESIEKGKKTIEIASSINAKDCVIIAGGLSNRYSHDDALNRIEYILSELILHSKLYGIKLSVEPLHPFFGASRGCINTLYDAHQFLQRFEYGDIGIILDTFHIWWDRQFEKSLSMIPSQQITSLQIADWSKEIKDPFTDRSMPGEGIIQFRPLLNKIFSHGYNGYIDFEIISNYWKSQPIKYVFQKMNDSIVYL